LSKFNWNKDHHRNIRFRKGDDFICGVTNHRYCRQNEFCNPQGKCCKNDINGSGCENRKDPNDAYSWSHVPQNCINDVAAGRDESLSTSDYGNRIKLGLYYSCDTNICANISPQNKVMGQEATEQQCSTFRISQKQDNGSLQGKDIAEKTITFKLKHHVKIDPKNRDENMIEIQEYNICSICGLKDDCIVAQKSLGNVCGQANVLWGTQKIDTLNEKAFFVCNTGHVDGCDKPVPNFSLLKISEHWESGEKISENKGKLNNYKVCWVELEELYDWRTDMPDNWDLEQKDEELKTCSAYIKWQFTREELDAIDAQNKHTEPKVEPPKHYKARRFQALYAATSLDGDCETWKTYQFIFKMRAPEKILIEEQKFVPGAYLFSNRVIAKGGHYGPMGSTSLFQGTINGGYGTYQNGNQTEDGGLIPTNGGNGFNNRVLGTADPRPTNPTENYIPSWVDIPNDIEIEKCRAPTIIQESQFIGNNIRKLLRLCCKRYLTISITEIPNSATQKYTRYIWIQL